MRDPAESPVGSEGDVKVMPAPQLLSNQDWPCPVLKFTVQRLFGGVCRMESRSEASVSREPP